MKTEASLDSGSANTEWYPVSNRIVRSICNPIEQEEELFETTFTVYASEEVTSAPDGHELVAVIGEIQTSNTVETHMVAATAIQLFVFEGKAPRLNDPEQYSRFVRQVVSRHGKLLEDYLGAYLRTVASGLTRPELKWDGTSFSPTLLSSDGMTVLSSPDE